MSPKSHITTIASFLAQFKAIAPLSRLGEMPAEILNIVFIHSENFALTLVNRYFHVALRDENTLFAFCLHMFLYRHEMRWKSHHVGQAQSAILRQKWFTARIAQ